MTKAVLSSCCFCASLRTGTIMVGYFRAITNVFLVIYGIALVVGLQEDIYGRGGVFSGALYIAAAGISAIFISYLIKGAHEDNPRHLEKYIIFTCLMLVLAVIGVFLNPLMALRAIPTIALEVYFVIVVRSRKLELESAPAARDVACKV